MRKLLQTLLFDLVMAVIILFFVYQFALITRLDQFVVRKVIEQLSRETTLETSSIAFTYKFPFTVKAQHISLGTRSMIGSLSVSINPMDALFGDTIRISELKLEDTLVFYEDYPAFQTLLATKNTKEHTGTHLRIIAEKIVLKRVYGADERGRYVRVDDAVLNFSSDDTALYAACNSLKGEVFTGIQPLPITISNALVTINGDDRSLGVEMGIGNTELTAHVKRSGGVYSGEMDITDANLSLIDQNVRGVVSVHAQLTGTDGIPQINGFVTVNNAGYRKTTLVNGKYTFLYTNDTLTFRDIAFSAGDMHFRGYVTSTLRGEAVVNGAFTVEHIKISDFITTYYSTDISANVVFNGKGRNWDDFNGFMNITDIKGRIQQSTITDGAFDIKKDGKLLTLSAFELTTENGSVSGEGNIYKDNFSFALTVQSLPLSLFLPTNQVAGDIDFRGVVTNDIKGLAGSGVFTAHNVAYKNKKIGQIFASIAHSHATTEFSIYINDVDYSPFPHITIGKMEGALTSTTASLRKCDVYFSDTQWLSISLTALQEKNVWMSTDFHAETVLGEKIISARSPLLIWGKNEWAVKDLHISDTVSSIKIDATANKDDRKMNVNLSGLIDIGRVNSYKEIFPDVEGQLSLNVSYLRDGDSIQSHIICDLPVFVMVYENFSQTRIDSIFFEAKYDQDHYTIEKFTFSVNDTLNTLTGRIDCDINNTLAFRSFELSGDIKKMYSSFLVNFATTDVSVTDGYFSGFLSVAYDGKLKVNADVKLADTQLIVFDIGNAVIERLNGHATVQNNHLIIHSIEGTANERGSVKMIGDIKDIIYDRYLDFTIQFDGMYVPNVWYFSGFAGGSIRILGKGNDEIMTGDITVDSGVWGAPFTVLSGTGRKELSGINMNIRMHGSNNIWWRNDSVNIEFDVDFIVKKVYVEGKTVLSGTMDAKKGTFYFLDVPFNVVKAQLMFANPEDISPDINLQGQTDIFYRGRKRINLYVTGSLAEPKITLMSDDPSLSQNDLLSLLAFNRPMNELENTGFMNEKAGEWATFYLQQRLLKPLKRSAMLDTLNVRGNLLSDNDRYLDVEVGKYLGNSFYVVYRNEMVKGQNQRFNVIYYINNNLSLETGAEEEKGDMKYNIDMKFKFKY